MRNTLILLVLVSIGLTTPALAKSHDGERNRKSDHRKVEKVQHNNNDHRNYARHDRQGKRYGHFQKRMKKLRKELRHERRDNRRMERRLDRRQDRRDARHSRQLAKRYGHRQYYPAPVVVDHRRSLLSLLAPSVVVRIPLNW